MISIPEYYQRYINPNVDLTVTNHVCCPFHSEDTPSFSYSLSKDVWRCFGACHKGGDVIALHQANYRLRSREEAEISLCKLLGLKVQKGLHRVEVSLDERDLERKAQYALAVNKAKSIEQWVELDYIMSLHGETDEHILEFNKGVKHET